MDAAIEQCRDAAQRLTKELVLWDALFKPSGPLLQALLGPDRPPFIEPAKVIQLRLTELRSALGGLREQFTEPMRQRFAALHDIEGVSYAGVTAASYTEAVYALAQLRLDSVSRFRELLREHTAGDEVDAVMSHWPAFRDSMARKGTVDGERLRVAVENECRRVLESADAPGQRRLPDAPQYVTLDQAAGIVQRHKDTLGRWLRDDQNAPQPAVEGGGGKPHEYLWSDLRPWLEEKSGRILPERFPA